MGSGWTAAACSTGALADSPQFTHGIDASDALWPPRVECSIAWVQLPSLSTSAPLPTPPKARAVHYLPSPVDAVLPATPPDPPPSDALGLPQLPPPQLRALLLRHAPRLRIETASDDDRIGVPRWRFAEGGDAAIAVDTGQSAVYSRIAYTHIGGRVRLQLVYTAWFPRRGAEHPADLLAGEIDGLVWRVTLDRDLEPLVYDSIHPCGCYHLFIPTPRVRARPPPQDADPLDEVMFAPAMVRAPGLDERIELHLAHRTHYLQRVGIAPAHDPATGGLPYRLRGDDELRTLAWPPAGPEGTRSLYGPDGLVPGSQRLERFVFWPMGIASAGQMRQWGHHATAFVGRRHFDDPWLIERYFERAASTPPGDPSAP